MGGSNKMVDLTKIYEVIEVQKDLLEKELMTFPEAKVKVTGYELFRNEFYERDHFYFTVQTINVEISFKIWGGRLDLVKEVVEIIRKILLDGKQGENYYLSYEKHARSHKSWYLEMLGIRSI